MEVKNKKVCGGQNKDLLAVSAAADEITVALAGNPNVGKSTVFNNLTGMKQHTGNWPGKTVAVASGRCQWGGKKLLLVDIPGTYSLLPHSAEEEAAGEYLCFGGADVAAVICDATCLERNLNLVLQVMEISKNVVVCLNMQDEAAKKGIAVDEKKLSEILGVPVVGAAAGKGVGMDKILEAVCEAAENPVSEYHKINYGSYITAAVDKVKAFFEPSAADFFNTDWLALRILADELYLEKTANKHIREDLICGSEKKREFLAVLKEEREKLRKNNINGRQGNEKERQVQEIIEDRIAEEIVKQAEKISRRVVHFENQHYNRRDRCLDKILTGKYTGLPIMLLLLALIFWITVVGANYPSTWLSGFFAWLGNYLTSFLHILNLPNAVVSLLMDGVYLVVTWVVAVMLPPMAIFFPLFTLLEDLGYLPRVAFNLDKYFKRCCACGKQCLTMCIDYIILQIKKNTLQQSPQETTPETKRSNNLVFPLRL